MVDNLGSFRSADGLALGDGAGVRHRDGLLELPREFRLHYGKVLPRLRVGWRITGPDQAPLIVALGGISADRRVVSLPGEERGWWQEVAGPARAVPIERHRLLSFDYLGGSGLTTGPASGESFAAVSTYDQAEILLLLLNHLGIRHIPLLLGASYGGMVGLAFAERHPDRIARLCAISAADRAHPMATAWRSVQRRAMRFGIQHGDGAGGLALARALGMATYRSPEEFQARFASNPRLDNDRFVFPVEEYLFARGGDFVARHRAEAYLCLSESIDLHRVDATRIFTPTTVIAITEDQLVPLTDARAMVARLPQAQLIELSSVYGHDTFLKANDQLKPIFARLLETVR